MHNLHYVVVEADSGEEACDYAEGQILDFGDENNWRTICGATSVNGEIYNKDEGRWEAETLEEIKKRIVEAVFGDGDSFMREQALAALEKNSKKEKMTGMDWYYVRKYAELEGARVDAKSGGHNKPDLTPETFNVFEDEYFSWKLDEFGLTNLTNGEGDKKKLWIVVVDMHS